MTEPEETILAYKPPTGEPIEYRISLGETIYQKPQDYCPIWDALFSGIGGLFR